MYVRVVFNIDFMNFESLQKQDHRETREGQEEILRLRLFSDLEVQVGQLELETWNQTQTSTVMKCTEMTTNKNIYVF